MSRYRGPKLRITRRLGSLPGLTQKQSKKKDRPGQHGKSSFEGGKKRTEYGVRLEEKQKLKYNYGLTESQLYRYIKEARRRQGVTGLILLQLLEMRLDSICFTLGFGPTITNTRQLVTHGHITVNGKVVNIPSFQCRIGDIIGIKPKPTSKTIVENNLKNIRFVDRPTHVKFDDKKLEGTIMNYCDRNEILLELDELLVIEYYSRR
jgi:small subunit ribosomal protein S4|uniref:Small ribosomal subunit protein uS4c n=1 Tax=Cerataulina bicornis TaxID=1527800 RepID=A0A089VIE5_CERBC|nr:ribosomal protein S4 [Cerataulina daemon]AIR76036.1 ribosomal protein S4 [Cerataulina daemon]